MHKIALFFLLFHVTTILTQYSGEEKVIAMDETERCIIETLKPDIPDNSIIIHDHQIITKALMNFELLDSSIQQKIQQCSLNLSLPKKRCEAVFGYNNCEKYYMMYFEKCSAGFTPVGCCICALICPEDTVPVSEGLLCKKPDIGLRKVFTDGSSCRGSGSKCSRHGDYYIENCKKGIFF